MSYQLGIDLGTTYTAAAVHRDGRASIFSLGGRSASIPSVVLLREDETVLTGDAAVRRAMTEPERVAREFKRRLGDTTPIIVGGSPYSAEALMARLLRFVLDEVVTREGSQPDRIAVSHPANWGEYKYDLLRQAIQLAGLDSTSVVLLSEPEAAAISYASQERVDPGEIVAVYDLGGGTFDAAVLRRTDEGFEIIGKPEGIERLGGIDFDAAVFAHVVRSLEGVIEELDQDDPTVISAVARLRQDCVDAKEALSSDTDATIPVLLPGLQTEVRLTRSEFEGLIRPSLVDSIDALRRAVRSAGLDASQVSKVLLVGGSSRVPLITQLVSSEFGRPIAVDAHPKHAIALGASVAAAAGSRGAAAQPDSPPADQHDAMTSTASAVPPVEAPPYMAPPTVEPPISAPMGSAPAPVLPMATPPTPDRVEPPTPTPAPIPTPEPTPAAVAEPTPAPRPVPQMAASTMGATVAAPEPPPTSPPTVAASTGGGGRLPLLVALGVGVVALLAIGGYALTRGGGGTDTAATDSSIVDQVDEGTGADPELIGDNTTSTASTTSSAPRTPADITADLQAALVGFGADDLEVTVDGTEAAISGTALDEQDQVDIEAAALAVAGVESVNSTNLLVLPADFRCTDLIKSQPRWLCIDSVEFDGTTVTATFEFEEGGEPFNVANGFHVHFFDGGTTEPITAGVNGGASTGGGDWQVWDLTPTYESTKFAGTEIEVLCARVATAFHTLESLDSGNCWPVTRTDG